LLWLLSVVVCRQCVGFVWLGCVGSCFLLVLCFCLCVYKLETLCVCCLFFVCYLTCSAFFFFFVFLLLWCIFWCSRVWVGVRWGGGSGFCQRVWICVWLCFTLFAQWLFGVLLFLLGCGWMDVCWFWSRSIRCVVILVCLVGGHGCGLELGGCRVSFFLCLFSAFYLGVVCSLCGCVDRSGGEGGGGSDGVRVLVV